MLLSNLMSGAEDPRFLRLVKSHPRYHLRLTAIIAGAFGLFFNVLAIAIAQEFILSGLAFIPLCISMAWNHLDLASNRLFKRELPITILIIVDTLGFLSFLALLIANGIVASELGYRRTGDAMLLAYASVPWMICCATHGVSLLQSVARMLRSRGRLVCPNCRHSWETAATKGQARANFPQAKYDSDDAEATPPSGSETSEEHEQAPEMRKSIDTTDETACLMYQNA